jgi:hypothetical protein
LYASWFWGQAQWLPQFTLPSACLVACRSEDKPGALLYLVREVLPADQPTIVFTCEHRCCCASTVAMHSPAAAVALLMYCFAA